MKILLVTLAIGDNYLKQYNFLFRESQENYAKRYGYDFKVVTDYLDVNPDNRIPSCVTFNKILVCSQDWSNDYDMIIFVDADILISVSAPPLHKYMDYSDKIGIADQFYQPTKERGIEIAKNRPDLRPLSPTAYYKLCDLDIETNLEFNTGVLVMQPKIHGEFLKSIYDKYVERSRTHHRGYHYEQSCIGYEIQKKNLYKVIPNKFNACWALILWDNIHNIRLEDYFKENWFIHFAGKAELNKVHALHKNYNTLF